MTIYLYVKTHNKTGLKYLGQTSSTNPHKYPGSGLYWQRHLKMHGYDYTTEIIKECQSKDELREWGEHYSDLWDVVKSEEWANLKPETADGSLGYIMTEEDRQKIRDGLKGKTLSDEHKKKLSELKKGKPGHPRSEEARAKMSATRKGKPKPPGYWEKWKAARAANRKSQ
jgi:hypothetical protein